MVRSRTEQRSRFTDSPIYFGSCMWADFEFRPVPSSGASAVPALFPFHLACLFPSMLLPALTHTLVLCVVHHGLCLHPSIRLFCPSIRSLMGSSSLTLCPSTCPLVRVLSLLSTPVLRVGVERMTLCHCRRHHVERSRRLSSLWCVFALVAFVCSRGGVET